MGKGILIKWVKGAFTKPLVILKGIWYNMIGKNQDLSDKRLNICFRCDHCIWYRGDFICDECGCILNNKTRLENEKCLMNKW